VRRLAAAAQVGAWLALHGATAHAAPADVTAAPTDHALRPLMHVVPYAPKFLYLFGLPVRWSGAIHWRYNAANAPPALSDAAATVARLQSTFDQWTSACGVRYVYDGPTSTLPDHRVNDPQKGEQPDFENVVGWGAPGVSVAGQTLAWYDDSDQGNFLVDTDMILSSTLVYEAGALARTAAHEFGHMLGLAHSNVKMRSCRGLHTARTAGSPACRPTTCAAAVASTACRGDCRHPTSVPCRIASTSAASPPVPPRLRGR
jgi:hypothetical protein